MESIAAEWSPSGRSHCVCKEKEAEDRLALLASPHPPRPEYFLPSNCFG
ncbi:hypothetical protein LEMLEM_LOCUS25053 [Lemmus lemmus]